MDPLKLAIADRTDDIIEAMTHDIRKEMGLIMQSGFGVAISGVPKAGRAYNRNHIFNSNKFHGQSKDMVVRVETTIIFEPYVKDPAAHDKCGCINGCDRCNKLLRGRRGVEI